MTSSVSNASNTPPNHSAKAKIQQVSKTMQDNLRVNAGAEGFDGVRAYVDPSGKLLHAGSFKLDKDG
jgi:hypothetical protein